MWDDNEYNIKYQILELLKDLSDDARLDIFNNFCVNCGSNDPGCYCWNDE